MSAMSRRQFIKRTAGTAAIVSLVPLPSFLLGQKADDGLPKEVSRYMKLIYNSPLLGNLGTGGSYQDRDPVRRMNLDIPRIQPTENTGRTIRDNHSKRFNECFGRKLDFGDISVSVVSGENLARLSINSEGIMYVFDFSGIGDEYMRRIAESSAKTNYMAADELLMGFEAVIDLDRDSFKITDDDYLAEIIEKDRIQRPKSWLLVKDSKRNGLNKGDNDFVMNVRRGKFPSLTPDVMVKNGQVASFGTYNLNGALTFGLDQKEMDLLHDHVTERYETILGYSLSQLKGTYSMMRRLGR